MALDDLKSLGFEVGSIYGRFTSETEDIRINNALLCHKYGFDMVGVGPLYPIMKHH